MTQPYTLADALAARTILEEMVHMQHGIGAFSSPTVREAMDLRDRLNDFLARESVACARTLTSEAIGTRSNP